MWFHLRLVPLVSLLCFCGCREAAQEPGERAPPTTAPIQAMEPDPVLLVSYKVPATWTERRHGIGQTAFVREHNHALSINVVDGPDLEHIANKARSYYTNLVELTKVAGSDAVRVKRRANNSTKHVQSTSYFVENQAGKFLEFRYDARTPEDEAEPFMASVRLLPAPPPGAPTTVTGKVEELTGNCMPPSPCVGRAMEADVVVRALGDDNSVGDVVARTRSGADGQYSLSIPPGHYTIRAATDGVEICKSSGPAGPCGVWVAGNALTHNITVDNAVW